ncbi:MAG: substrate-binding domain-containing protein, partial [Erysipelotrichaceae bacterium]|nr:substrate-binding domain-containing protein [Erysipelotrichaceae bacterium]
NRLLQLPQLPTAVFVVCDLSALGVVRCISEHNLVVGKDISVVGFDDIELAAHVHPALTTLKQDRKTIGKILAETLIKRMNNETVEEKIVIPTKLIVRDSTSKID